jgi:hypothetical protein
MMLFLDEDGKLYHLFFSVEKGKPLLIPLASSHSWPHRSAAWARSETVSLTPTVQERAQKNWEHELQSVFTEPGIATDEEADIQRSGCR